MNTMNATVSLIVDNFCLVCSGNGTSVDKIWASVRYEDSSSMAKATKVSLFSLSQFSFVYLAAWSDYHWHKVQEINGQGLLASVGFAHPAGLTNSGDRPWQVSASKTPMKVEAQKPTIVQINAVIRRGLWASPVLSSLDVPYNPAKIKSYPIPGRWMWCDSGSGRSGDPRKAPFWPGWDHGEFLLFRLPPPRSTEPFDLELFFKVNFPKSESDSLEQSLVDPIPTLLYDLAAYISVTSPGCVNVEGHTSQEGNDNDALSLRRAKSVAAWLSKKSGLSSDRIESQGFGSSKPKYDQKTKDVKNRRVAISLSW